VTVVSVHVHFCRSLDSHSTVVCVSLCVYTGRSDSLLMCGVAMLTGKAGERQ